MAKVEEGPNFDGTVEVADNMAATESAAPVDGDTLRVRYTGTSNVRTLTRADLSGQASLDSVGLTFVPGSEVPYDWWLDLAGSDEKAREVLQAQTHEFILVGPGSEEFWAGDEGEEEFSIEGAVKD